MPDAHLSGLTSMGPRNPKKTGKRPAHKSFLRISVGAKERRRAVRVPPPLCGKPSERVEPGRTGVASARLRCPPSTCVASPSPKNRGTRSFFGRNPLNDARQCGAGLT